MGSIDLPVSATCPPPLGHMLHNLLDEIVSIHVKANVYIYAAAPALRAPGDTYDQRSPVTVASHELYYCRRPRIPFAK